MSQLQEELPLLNQLQQCSELNHASFYTPGHKRGQGAAPPLLKLLGTTVFQADLPELPELDNLFAPQGVIWQAQQLAADLFGAEQTWFLANGSTCGLVAAILATCDPGDKIILPRNVHYSAISGLILSGAVPVFLQPEYDLQLDIAHSITPGAVTEALEAHPDAKAVMMVSPTYYGVCGDVAAIAQLCHQHQLPLLVDEAHGAHFAFHPDLPTPALAAGADLAVQSTHKTLAALTQAAMMHVQGDRIDRDRVAQAIALVQSTSPSYLLLASLDAARQQMALHGRGLMERTLQLADWMRTTVAQMPGLTTLAPTAAVTEGFVALDRTRLTVNVARLGLDGFAADQILTAQSIVAELPSLQNLTFIVTHGNTWEDGKRLVAGFQQLAEKFGADRAALQTANHSKPEMTYFSLLSPCPLSLSPRQAFFASGETVPLAAAIDRISKELVCPYPPGIPILLPGEVVTSTAIAHLQALLAAGSVITGCADPSLKTLQVLR